jgi:glycosyltransferase involved in cell wall biosynthesis
MIDPLYGAAAISLSKRNRSDFFLYSPYAYDAFTENYSFTPRKLLFQFHPHHESESTILRQDIRFSESNDIHFDLAFESGVQQASISRMKGDDSWKFADRVFCASQFTKNTLVQHGANPNNIIVVPYGIDISQPSSKLENQEGNFEVLYVGSGLQRKGLHHLLMAWERASLKGARLTIVARILDPALSPLLARTNGVRLMRGASKAQLTQLYRGSTLFVMPSLVEGFGQVFLEALGHGLPILGTPNTCCPDLGGEDGGVFVTPAGNVDALAGTLQSLSRVLPRHPEFRQMAFENAKRFSWERFRSQLISGIS